VDGHAADDAEADDDLLDTWAVNVARTSQAFEACKDLSEPMVRFISLIEISAKSAAPLKVKAAPVPFSLGGKKGDDSKSDSDTEVDKEPSSSLTAWLWWDAINEEEIVCRQLSLDSVGRIKYKPPAAKVTISRKEFEFKHIVNTRCKMVKATTAFRSPMCPVMLIIKSFHDRLLDSVAAYDCEKASSWVCCHCKESTAPKCPLCATQIHSHCMVDISGTVLEDRFNKSCVVGQTFAMSSTVVASYSFLQPHVSSLCKWCRHLHDRGVSTSSTLIAAADAVVGSSECEGGEITEAAGGGTGSAGAVEAVPECSHSG